MLVDFGDLEFNGGPRTPGTYFEPFYGVSIEVKSSVYAWPHCRALVGVTFSGVALESLDPERVFFRTDLAVATINPLP